MFSHSLLLCTLLLCVTVLHSTKGAALNLNHRIIGGQLINISQVPYQVSVHLWSSYICGGSILNNRYILTAAQCVYRQFTPGSISVQVGSSVSDLNPLFIRFVIDIFQHPKYNFGINDYDVAILQLTVPLLFTPNIAPVVLVTSLNGYKDGDIATVCGWGHTWYGGTVSRQLRTVDVNLVNRTVCQDNYFTYAITPRMICAAAPGKDACQGDTGSALTSKGKQIGIVSWGFGCASPKFPGVYASVGDSEINQWIQQKIQQSG